MEHVVFYPGAGGVPAFQRVGSLDAAVSYVERLRNTANVTEFSVYELTPVPLSMRAYYRVEVPATDEVAAPGAAVEDSQYAEPEAPAEADEALPVPAVEQAVQFALGDVAEDAEPVSAPAVVRPQLVSFDELAAVAEPIAVEGPAAQPLLAAVHDGPDEAPVEADHSASLPATSEILTAAAAAAAYVTAPDHEEPAEPVADVDRSEEWVAEASVIEPAFVTPELPVLDDDQSSPDAVHLAVAPSVAAPLPPSLQVTPFAVAPPVGSSIPAPYDPEPEDVADFPVDSSAGEPVAADHQPPAFEPVGGDIIPTVPASRRSMGFFAR